MEALLFTLAVAAYIWELRFRWPWTIWLVAMAALWRLRRRRGETLQSLGFRPRAFLALVVGWLALSVAASHVAAALPRGLLYFLWCVLQQLIYQNLVYKPLRDELGAGWQAWAGAGVLFGFVHLPNPVLAPATLVWGALASLWFERRRDVVSLGLAQTALSWLLEEVTPPEWRRNFRVGPGYFVY